MVDSLLFTLLNTLKTSLLDIKLINSVLSFFVCTLPHAGSWLLTTVRWSSKEVAHYTAEEEVNQVIRF